MTAYFLDTSAHLKRYLKETGSEVVDSLFEEYAPRYVSGLGLLECLSSLQRLYAVTRLITEERLRLLRAAIASDIDSGRVAVISPTAADVQVAAGILSRRYLTAVDALQLAMAKDCGVGIVFVSSDEKLNRVAAEEGLTILDPAAGKP